MTYSYLVHAVVVTTGRSLYSSLATGMMADKTLLPLGSHGKSSSGGIEMTRAISGGGDSATNVALRAVQEDDDGDDGNKNKKLGVFAISSSRLLCLIMALDLMTLSVQVYIH